MLKVPPRGKVHDRFARYEDSCLTRRVISGTAVISLHVVGENFLNLLGGRLPEQRPLAEFHRPLRTPDEPVYTTEAPIGYNCRSIQARRGWS